VSKNGNKVLDLWHTEVPVEHRGKGIAEVLAIGVMDQLSKEKVMVKLSCSYLRDNFLPKHPEYRSLVVE